MKTNEISVNPNEAQGEPDAIQENAGFNFYDHRLSEIIHSMFDDIKEKVSGIHVRMYDGTMCNIEIFELDRDNVEIRIDNVMVGRFEKPETEHAGYQIDFMPRSTKNVDQIKFDMLISLIKANPRIRVYDR